MPFAGGTGHNPAGMTACLLLGLCMAGPATGAIAPPFTEETQSSSRRELLALSEIGDAKTGVGGNETSTDEATGIPVPDGEFGDTLETDVTDEEIHPVTVEKVDVLYDLSKLPEPVRRMRALIVAAAEKGNVEALRPLLGTGVTRTQLSIGGYEGDPIEFLKEISGDGEGQELLAILLDIFSAGYVHVDQGEPTEAYIWPYFYSMPLDHLTDRQKVELYRIITAGDYEDMKAFGAYIFYRTAIDPDGEWKFFVAGD
ncbi:hypothetical protein [Hoeflea sp. TYP-13]|uniref:hypothetical protein n=1 Tax=Hoeflea sp. TYP-13 TaxID=3230023 RepID=UPI0034C6CE09